MLHRMDKKEWGGGSIAKERPKLTFVFHNPNDPDEFEKYLTKFLVQVNMKKAERAINEALSKSLASEAGTKEETKSEEEIGLRL